MSRERWNQVRRAACWSCRQLAKVWVAGATALFGLASAVRRGFLTAHHQPLLTPAHLGAPADVESNPQPRQDDAGLLRWGGADRGAVCSQQCSIARCEAHQLRHNWSRQGDRGSWQPAAPQRRRGRLTHAPLRSASCADPAACRARQHTDVHVQARAAKPRTCPAIETPSTSWPQRCSPSCRALAACATSGDSSCCDTSCPTAPAVDVPGVVTVPSAGVAAASASSARISAALSVAREAGRTRHILHHMPRGIEVHSASRLTNGLNQQEHGCWWPASHPSLDPPVC